MGTFLGQPTQEVHSFINGKTAEVVFGVLRTLVANVRFEFRVFQAKFVDEKGEQSPWRIPCPACLGRDFGTQSSATLNLQYTSRHSTGPWQGWQKSRRRESGATCPSSATPRLSTAQCSDTAGVLALVRVVFTD